MEDKEVRATIDFLFSREEALHHLHSKTLDNKV